MLSASPCAVWSCGLLVWGAHQPTRIWSSRTKRSPPARWSMDEQYSFVVPVEEHPLRHFPRTAVAVGLLVLAAGCGSTVQPGALSGSTTTGSDGLGFATEGPAAPGAGNELGTGTGPGTGGTTGGLVPGGTTGAGGLPGGTGATGTTGTGGGGGGSSTTGTSGSGSQQPPNATEGGGAPGVTDKTITLGITYTENSKAAGAAFGAGNVQFGDPLAQQKVLINDINKRGGIFGRQLTFVAHAYDATASTPYDQQDGEACERFTNDNKVFAVMAAGVSDALRPCVAKAGAVQIEVSAQSFTTAATFQQFPYYIEPAGLGLDRVVRQWVPALQQQNYFAKWNFDTGSPGVLPVKVGVLLLDDRASVAAYTQILAPALKAAGYDVIDFRAPAPQDFGGSSSTVSAVQSAVLKFRREGVTHFLPLDSGAGLSLYFGQNANSQRYYPRYGLQSGAGVQVLIDSIGFPKEQLNGALGYGWNPYLDVSAADNADNGPNSNAARRACFAVLERGGQAVPPGPARRGAVEQCDKYRFLEQALKAGGPALNRASFLAGVNATGTGYLAGSTFRTRLNPSQHTGIAAYKPFAYNTGCGCFRYSGGLNNLP